MHTAMKMTFMFSAVLAATLAQAGLNGMGASLGNLATLSDAKSRSLRISARIP